MLSSRLLSRHFVRPFVAQTPRVFLSTSSSDMHLIINAVGKDRLGIVSDVTGMVIDAGGNVGDSQASKLGSHFSLMMEVTLPRDRIDSLQSQLSSMADMNATVYQDQEASSAKTPQIGYLGTFNLEGADNPGIVHKVTSALTRYGLSVDKMQTDQEIAPHGGTTLFKMNGVVSAAAPLAAGFDIEKVKADVEAMGESLNCDVSLEDA